MAALDKIMAWRRRGVISEPMMLSRLTHICVTRPQWVKILFKVNGQPCGASEVILHYWDRVTYKRVAKLDHHWLRLWLVAEQIRIWTNAGVLSTGHMGTCDMNQNTTHFIKKMYLKKSFANWWSFPYRSKCVKWKVYIHSELRSRQAVRPTMCDKSECKTKMARLCTGQPLPRLWHLYS